MGWRDRDYANETWTGRGPAAAGLRWPTRTVVLLIGLHIAAFVFVHLMASTRAGAEAVRYAALTSATAQPQAILLHPFATRNFLTFVVDLLVIWLLGGYVAQRYGGRRTITLYVFGNLGAGAAFFALARLQPGLAGVELDSPTGAMAAWLVTACRGLGGEVVGLFGRWWNARRLLAVCVAVAVGLMLALRGSAALGWVVAVAAGALIEPVVVGVPRWRAGRRRPAPLQPTVRRVPRRRPATPPPADAPDIDDILAKISRSGLASLTSEEFARLNAAREAKLRQAVNQRGTTPALFEEDGKRTVDGPP